MAIVTVGKLEKMEQETVKQLLDEFAKEAGEDIHPMGTSFFDKVKELFD